MQKSLLLVVLFLAGCESLGTGSSTSSSGGAASTSATPAAAAVKRDKLEGIPLVWRPTSNPASMGAVDLTNMANVSFQVNPLTDGREDKSFIGQNIEKQPPRKVSTPDDVPAFVTSHMKSLLSQAGYKVVDSGGTVQISGDLKQFFVTEQDTYKGDVRIQITATDASGKVLWSGVTGGAATRFGRSYKDENYYETLSDSVVEATYSLLQNASFHSAVAAK